MNDDTSRNTPRRGAPRQTVTRLLRVARSNPDDASAGRNLREGPLYEKIHDELRRRAHRERRRWKGDPSLRTTALAHEAYLKLVAVGERSWEERSHFLAVAATAMRHILIDHARHKTAQKRGGDEAPLSLEELRDTLGREVAINEENAEAFVLLDEALDRLDEEHPRAARVVECRFFSGMSIEETAEALDVSTATVSRDWKQARAWLYREMERIRSGGQAPGDAQGEGSPETGGQR
ncbi:MAG: ECF-type sigma factor [Salinivenus sp.]